jgi:hypothetical protein
MRRLDYHTCGETFHHPAEWRTDRPLLCTEPIGRPCEEGRRPASVPARVEIPTVEVRNRIRPGRRYRRARGRRHAGSVRRSYRPTLTDLAFESGRTIGLEAEREVDPPASYSAAERGAFLDGLAEAFAILAAREADYLAELAENDANVEAVCRGFVPL